MTDRINNPRDNWPIGIYQLSKISLSCDILHLHATLNVETESDYNLVTWSYFLESYPVQAYVFLSFSEIEESSTTPYTIELDFDLTPMKHAYLEMYPEDDDIHSIDIKICDPNDPYEFIALVRYDF